MRIKSIELAWFRGAADPVSLDLDCKSVVIYGTNSSGKSSFVDAVEYVLNNGRIQHLRHEYTDSKQGNAIPNTHKPDTSNAAINIRFQDDTDLHIEFKPTGPSKTQSSPTISMEDWGYRQTVLRQDEVSAFIHDTKGDKYSALLPLFGLQHLEVAAENIRQLAKALTSEANLNQKNAKLGLIEQQRHDVFGSQSYDDIVNNIKGLYVRYYNCQPSIDDAQLLCEKVETAIGVALDGFSAESKRHFFLRQLAESSLKQHIDSVRSLSVDLSSSVETNVGDRLEILNSASRYGAALEGMAEIDCPACGQSISADAFREHVQEEKKRLQDLNDIFTKYKFSITSVCASLESLKSNLTRPELFDWKTSLDVSLGLQDPQFLEQVNLDILREHCSDDLLKALETNVCPIVAHADQESKSAPPDVTQLNADQKQISVAKEVTSTKDLKSEVEYAEALVALTEFLEQEVRSEIKVQSEGVIHNISKDIESMWSILHPGDKVDNVRLSVPQNLDKAIDVALRFHGLDQDSPRLTLSEGYRNSLGLCIFLAMAKQVSDDERPLFLDDVVVSFDRDHRGMIQELLEKEFSGRQVIIFTHDREWYTELRYQLGNNNRWTFKSLLPYDTPRIGIRFSNKTTTFEDALAHLEERPDSAGNDARKIMDVDLPMICQHLQLRLPYQRSDRNDLRTANEFLTRLVADGKICFEKRTADQYAVYAKAIEAWSEANALLLSWGNRGSHSFNVVKSEATKLIDACEAALGFFKCDSCSSNVWRLEDEQSKLVQCRCGDIRWRYGKV